VRAAGEDASLSFMHLYIAKIDLAKSRTNRSEEYGRIDGTPSAPKAV